MSSWRPFEQGIKTRLHGSVICRPGEFQKRFAAGWARGLVIAAVVLGAMNSAAMAADPPSGTLSETITLVSWTGEFLTPTASAECGGPNNPACDNFQLNILPPPSGFNVEIRFIPQGAAGDWDLQVFGPNGQLVDDSGNAAGQAEEIVLFNPAAGTYTISAAPYAPMPGASPNYLASATLSQIGPPGNEPLTFTNYPAPNPLGRDAAEPTIGINFNTDRVMFIAGLETLRITFDDCTSPPTALWEDVSYLLTSVTTADPILFTDKLTGRTFVSQLAGETSLMAYTDDDGNTWFPVEGSGTPSGIDHQTVGGGPFRAPLTPATPYPNAVYYASQGSGAAFAARSDDGGVTFGSGIPMYTAFDCGGLHGSLKVAPDGTVYVPNKNCLPEQGVVVSEDNGLTWSVRRVPSTTNSRIDPSVGIATDGTIYLGMANGDGHPWVAVSHDKGITWTNLQDVGVPFNIQNTAFPVVVAGDPDRASFAFLGTSATGDGTGDDPAFAGVWYVYSAHTYDGGLSWTTVNVTPGDPVQRGTVCMLGFGPTGCGCCRNLLDFMDSEIDRFGRVLIGYADGCLGGCVNGLPNSDTQLAVVARQLGGRRMFAAFDNIDLPAAPLARAALDAQNNALVHITWETPDDHGSPLTGYRIYKRLAAGSFSLLASPAASVHSLDDTINPSESYFYKVTAVSAVGEGPSCRELSPTGQTAPPNACISPGLQVASDPPGDYAFPAGDTPHDILSVSIAGLLPEAPNPPSKILVTLKVDNLNSPPAYSTWRAIWTSPDSNTYYVEMSTLDPSVGTKYRYGTYDGNTFTPVGFAESGLFSSDGTIRIRVSAANVGNPQSGQSLTGISARTEFQPGGSGPPQLIDEATAGSAFILGSCNPGNPNARDDLVQTAVNSPVVIEVLANDDDPNFDTLNVIAVTQPGSGATLNLGDGTVRYTPNAGFEGTDTFTYTASDPGGLTDTAVVSVIVGPCLLDPIYTGLGAVSSPLTSTCSLELSWSAGSARCPFTNLRYNIYRSTDANFVPGVDNLLVAGHEGLSYLDQQGLQSGVTYYYVVRAEDSSGDGDGPANNGNQDDNVERKSGTPLGVLGPGPDYVDDIEPAANPGYSVASTRISGQWTVLPESTAHSPNNAWVALDEQPGVPTGTPNDNRLTLPALNLTSGSILTFWHNYDFAHFPAVPNVQSAEHHSGGVLEISADGQSWHDLGPWITAGGYTGTVDAGALNPIAGRPAWVESSDDTVGNRTDPMQLVSVNLGAAISDPGLFGVSQLTGASVRFRLGGTFQILLGGVQGTGWAVDDISITQVQHIGPCTSCSTCAGDLNGDGLLNGGDIREFVPCVLQGCPTISGCADFTGDGQITIDDTPEFVEVLLSDPDSACP